MTLEAVLDDLRREPSNISVFKSLGDLLREESVRTSETIKTSLPLILEYSNHNLSQYLGTKSDESQPLVLEVERCIVNLLADSDENRQFFQSKSEYTVQFWNLIKRSLVDPQVDLAVNRRIVIILGQFVHSNEYKQDYLSTIFQYGLLEPVYTFMNQNFNASVQAGDIFNFQNGFEFLKEIIEVNQGTILSSPQQYGNVSLKLINYLIETLTQILRQLNKFNISKDSPTDDDDDEISDLEDIDEISLTITETIALLTAFEDLDLTQINTNERILKLFDLVPKEFPNQTHIKRKLFGISGCVSSMKSYDNTYDLDLSIQYFQSGDSDSIDPYALAASAITLGNYINSKQKLDYVISKIEETMSIQKFMAAFFSIRINDVIQIQSLHLLNNILTDSNSRFVLTNYEHFFNRFAKIIIDNGKYYQDVLKIFNKFINKLVRLAFIANKDNILDFTDLWYYIIDGSEDTHELQLLLLQAYIVGYGDVSPDTPPYSAKFFKLLIHNLVSVPPSTVSISVMLEKLKTTGMFNHSLISNDITPDQVINYVYNEDVDELAKEYIVPYLAFLVQLKTQLEIDSGTRPPQFEILLNNSKFVCATTITFWSPKIHIESVSEVLGICKEIASIEF